MLYPEIGKLMKNMNSRYTLVIATAKRARQLADEHMMAADSSDTDKYVSMAVNEIADGIVKCRSEEENEEENKED